MATRSRTGPDRRSTRATSSTVVGTQQRSANNERTVHSAGDESPPSGHQSGADSAVSALEKIPNNDGGTAIGQGSPGREGTTPSATELGAGWGTGTTGTGKLAGGSVSSSGPVIASRRPLLGLSLSLPKSFVNRRRHTKEKYTLRWISMCSMRRTGELG